MSKELSKIGDYAVAAWARRDRAMEQRLEKTAYIMSRAMAAVDASMCPAVGPSLNINYLSSHPVAWPDGEKRTAHGLTS